MDKYEAVEQFDLEGRIVVPGEVLELGPALAEDLGDKVKKVEEPSEPVEEPTESTEAEEKTEDEEQTA